jgi:hypothetical protein
VPLDGVVQGASELLAIKRAFDQVVLNAVMYGLERQGLVFKSRQDNYWHAGSPAEYTAKCRGPVAVRKIQIEQDHRRRLQV